MTDPGARRILSEGWCPESESWADARASMSADMVQHLAQEFAPASPEERAAAELLATFTRAQPWREDCQEKGRPGCPGAVDIVLTDEPRRPQVVEVTTSLDTRYQGAAGACARFEAEVQRHYTGRFAWQLDLERGWEHTRLVRELAPDVAAALNAESAATSPRDVIDIGPHVRALLIGPLDPSLVFVMSRNAGANNLDGPYLDALSDYLACDPVIGRKLDKLARDRDGLDADRVHLFVAMATTGSHGGLFPASPSYFTWGTFTLPPFVTDIWLQGNELYHWTAEAGWVFHELHEGS